MKRRTAIENWPIEAHGRPLRLDHLDAREDVLLDAHVRPNRSLGSPAFIALMVAIAVISFTAGLAFLLAGAWPVLGFFGLDVLIVWLAFRLNYRDGRRLERIHITPDAIHVMRRWPTGYETLYRLPSAWTRLVVDHEDDPDVQPRLTAMGKHVLVGSVLSPRERRELAGAIGEALAKARTSPVALAQETGGAA
ncbi:hypothetical protein X907_0124 [Glycocaulis alkaliphilus]|uniref:DUF2244 domain-containing protein n=1 Tax=Glycocaulis alkaliphilus TaxID=1434191 RepID=A0A3T0E5M5_9PROT|nr:DUF2244 domain-containing protein [Glycocaulis alkaliphilus]AZU02674.1 hypothetical protein X907_0124 [Glycocaulis alkaliphilus]